MLRQRDAWGLARVAEPRICVVETGNVKKRQIDSGKETYKGRLTAFELDCNIYREQLRWLLSCATPPTSL